MEIGEYFAVLYFPGERIDRREKVVVPTMLPTSFLSDRFDNLCSRPPTLFRRLPEISFIQLQKGLAEKIGCRSLVFQNLHRLCHTPPVIYLHRLYTETR